MPDVYWTSPALDPDLLLSRTPEISAAPQGAPVGPAGPAGAAGMQTSCGYVGTAPPLGLGIALQAKLSDRLCCLELELEANLVTNTESQIPPKLLQLCSGSVPAAPVLNQRNGSCTSATSGQRWSFTPTACPFTLSHIRHEGIPDGAGRCFPPLGIGKLLGGSSGSRHNMSSPRTTGAGPYSAASAISPRLPSDAVRMPQHLARHAH